MREGLPLAMHELNKYATNFEDERREQWGRLIGSMLDWVYDKDQWRNMDYNSLMALIPRWKMLKERIQWDRDGRRRPGE